ncbi:hypothetical protein BX589_12825 [Paraburkholderia fungorum]|nr:hypothetical protein BX589_12825 [Paraburkholderia fungorum]
MPRCSATDKPRNAAKPDTIKPSQPLAASAVCCIQRCALAFAMLARLAAVALTPLLLAINVLNSSLMFQLNAARGTPKARALPSAAPSASSVTLCPASIKARRSTAQPEVLCRLRCRRPTQKVSSGTLFSSFGIGALPCRKTSIAKENSWRSSRSGRASDGYNVNVGNYARNRTAADCEWCKRGPEQSINETFGYTNLRNTASYSGSLVGFSEESQHPCATFATGSCHKQMPFGRLTERHYGAGRLCRLWVVQFRLPRRCNMASVSGAVMYLPATR